MIVFSTSWHFYKLATSDIRARLSGYFFPLFFSFVLFMMKCSSKLSFYLGHSYGRECYVCTYKDGSDTLPTIEGVSWASAGSSSYSEKCKDGDSDDSVVESCSGVNQKCEVRESTDSNDIRICKKEY